MKKTKQFGLLFTMGWMMMALVLTGCATNCKTTDKPYAVENHHCFLKHFTHLEPNDYDMYVAIDIPVNAPKAITDSITVFMNEELYSLFDNGEDRHLSYEKVFSTNLTNLAEHYCDAYRPFYDEDEPYITEYVHWLELNMVAQTETYVTYEVLCGFMGEGLEELRSWTTFVKKDGLRLKEVISSENMLRFYEDYPEFMDFDIWCDVQHDLTEGFSFSLDNTGLLNDSLAFQYFWNMGIYEDYKYPLKYLKPYLSEEAQALVSDNGITDAKNTFDEIGDVLGTVKTAKGKNVYLAARYDAVMAYTKTNTEYVSIDVFDVNDGYQRFINTLNCSGWYNSNPNFKFYAFNESDNTLYVPVIKTIVNNGGKESESFNDRYYVYRFDGKHFVNTGEDGGFWLHPSLRQFEALEYYGKTEDYLLRIDRMADGSFRLAAWKDKNDMMDAPDIVAEGGSFSEPSYAFKSEDYSYAVIDKLLEQDELRIYAKDGRLILSQKMRKVY